MAINLGDINFGLGPDTSRLQSAMSQVLQFGTAVNRAARSQADGAKEVEAAMRRQEAAILSALASTQKMNDAIRDAGGNGNLLQTTTAAFNRLTREMTDGRATALQYQRAQEDFRASMLRVERTLDGVNVGLKAQADAQKLAANAAKQNEQAILTQERIMFSATQQVNRYNAALNQMSQHARAQLTGGFNPQERLGQLQTAITAPGATRLDQQRAVQGFTGALNQAKVAAKEVSESGLAGFFEKVSQNAMLLAGPLSGVAFRLTLVSNMIESVGLATTGMIAGVAAGSFAVFKLGEEAINAQRKMQQIQLTLTAVSGSSVFAANDIEFLRGVATRAGASFEELASGYGKLEAASRGTSVEGQKTRTMFEQLVLAEQKMGGSNSELQGALLAVEHAMSRGTISAQTLHLQLGNRLPGAMSIMAEALGVSNQKVNEFMRSGELTIGMLEKFFNTMAKRYDIHIGDSITTTNAAIGRLSTSFFMFNNTVDSAVGFSNAFVSVLNGLSRGFDFLARNMQQVVGVFGAASGAILAVVSPMILQGFISLASYIRGATIAMVGLNVATMENPLGALATVLVRVAVAVLGAVAGYELLSRATSTNSNVNADAEQQIRDYIKAQSDLKSNLESMTQEHITSARAIVSALDMQVKAQEDAITKQRQIGSTMMIPGIDMPSGTVDVLQPMIDTLKQLQEHEKAAKGELQSLIEILEKQQGKNAGLKDVFEYSPAQQDAITRAKDNIQNLKEQLQSLTMPAGYDREFLKSVQESDKAIASFTASLQRAKLDTKDPALFKSLLDQFTQFEIAVRNQTFADNITKAVDSVELKITEANEKIKAISQSPGQQQIAQAWERVQKAVHEAVLQMERAGVPTAVAANEAIRLQDALTAAEKAAIGDKLNKSMKDAKDTIDKTVDSYNQLFLTPYAKEWAQMYSGVNDAVDKYHDKLVKEGVDIKQVTILTENYRQALTKLKEGELQLKDFPSVFSTISNIFTHGLDSAVDNFVSAIAQGKSVAEAFRNTWVSVLQDIMKEFLKLGVTHPLENMLFGTNQPVIGGIGGGAGGLLGGLFGGTSTLKNPFTSSGGWGLGLPGGGLPSTPVPIDLKSVGGTILPSFGGGASPVTSAVSGWPSFSSMLPWPGASTSGTSPEMSAAAAAIKKIESGSFAGNYGLVQPGSGALGAYQVMPENVGPWSQKWLGQSMTPNQFLQNPQAQDQIFQGQFGSYASKYGYTGASQAWFAGEGGMKNLGATDQLGTSVSSYGNQFDKYFAQMGDATKSVTKDLTSMSDKVPSVVDSMSSSMSKAETGITTFTTAGLAPAETAMTTYAGSTLTSATEQTAATTASTTALGTSAATAAVGVEALGTASTTAAGESAFKGGVSAIPFLSFLPSKLGNVFNAGNPIKFAGGGIVDRPTFFAMGGGGTGLMGEAGPEAIMPLVRDGGGRLGVKSSGGGGGDWQSAIEDLKTAIGGIQPQVNLKNVNTFDSASFLQEALASRGGEQAMLNFVKARPSAFRGATG